MKHRKQHQPQPTGMTNTEAIAWCMAQGAGVYFSQDKVMLGVPGFQTVTKPTLIEAIQEVKEMACKGGSE